MPKAKPQSAAVLTIKKPGAMDDKGRRLIAKWLRQQATDLLAYGERYVDDGNFVARYMY